MILNAISNNDIDNNKLLYLRIKSSPAIASVLEKKISKNYTPEEQIKLNNDILMLKEEIIEMSHLLIRPILRKIFWFERCSFMANIVILNALKK